MREFTQVAPCALICCFYYSVSSLKCPLPISQSLLPIPVPFRS
jgi:hypothetical protein